MRPRYMVKSQLKTFTPVGMPTSMVATEKKVLTMGPAPMVKKWCSQTAQEMPAMAKVAATMVM